MPSLKNQTREITHGRARLVRALSDAGILQQDLATLMCCNPGRINEVLNGEKFPNAGTADLRNAYTRALLGLCLIQATGRLTKLVTPFLETDDQEAV